MLLYLLYHPICQSAHIHISKSFGWAQPLWPLVLAKALHLWILRISFRCVIFRHTIVMIFNIIIIITMTLIILMSRGALEPCHFRNAIGFHCCIFFGCLLLEDLETMLSQSNAERQAFTSGLNMFSAASKTALQVTFWNAVRFHVCVGGPLTIFQMCHCLIDRLR